LAVIGKFDSKKSISILGTHTALKHVNKTKVTTQ